jgi:hypothetical protein
MSAFLYSLQHDLTPTLLVVGAVMFGAWTVAYAQIVYVCFRDKTYGLPLPSILLNISWEAIFGFQLIAPGVLALVWGNRLWFVVDCLIVLQVFLYGKQAQTNPWLKRWFYPITIAGLVMSFVGLLFFTTYINDVYGLATSFLMNFAMSLMFIALLFSRPDLRGLPYAAAWAKMIGTLAGAVFCTLWWPMQFDASGTLVRPPYIQRPPNSDLLFFLYFTIPLIDLLYIYLHRQRQREIAAERAAGASPPAVPAAAATR